MKNLNFKIILEKLNYLDEDYPIGFDLNKFKEIKTHTGKIEYAEQYLGKPLGQGSSRIVYKVDDTKVLKLARNKKGLAQNSAETDWHQFNIPILAKIFDFDDNDLWVEMELARKAKLSDFKKILNVNFKLLMSYLTYKENLIKRGKKLAELYSYIPQEQIDYLDEIEEISDLVEFMVDSNSPVGDLSKLNSWGVVKRDGQEKLVLVDYGLTEETYKCYYCVN